MKVSRLFTTVDQDPLDSIEFVKRTSDIKNPDGSLVFKMNDVLVPKTWSQVATDIIAQKYFRKAGVPRLTKKHNEKGIPKWLQASSADLERLEALPEKDRYSSETDCRQVFHRLAGTWTYWGFKADYFNTEEDAKAFYDEILYMLASQMTAPNSPQWFNTGLHWAYGINGPSQGHYYVDYKTGKLTHSTDAYTHPQPHACFIQSVSDDLVNEGGIMDLWTREARLFKYGSGTGTNYSDIRGANEPLSGGGRSSGLMSFLKIGDRSAGAIKSGGTTRRAAKMVTLDVDHPDIEEFINWKVVEEQKVASMVAGSQICNLHLNNIMSACFKEHPENEKNSFWKFARENDVENKMRAVMKGTFRNALTIQGELVGEGIQKNKYRIKGQEVRFFRVFDPISYTFFPVLEAAHIIEYVMGLKFVPIIESDLTLPDTIEELIAMADGRSALQETAREGIVFVAESIIGGLDVRPLEDYQGRLSFKVISNKFILEHDL